GVVGGGCARRVALRTREVAMVLYPPAEQLAAVRGDGELRLYNATGTRTIMIFMNLGLAPLDDQRVRHALMMGFNRTEVAARVVQQLGTLATGLMAPNVFGAASVNLDTVYPYDPPRARALLQQAGYQPGQNGMMERGGAPLVLTMLTSRGRYPRDAECAEAFQAQMREIGVQVELQAVEFAALVTAMRAATLNKHLILGAYASVS